MTLPLSWTWVSAHPVLLIGMAKERFASCFKKYRDVLFEKPAIMAHIQSRKFITLVHISVALKSQLLACPTRHPLNRMAFQSQMPNQDFLWQVFQKWVSLNTHPDVFYSRSGSKLSIRKLLRLIHVFLMIPELIAIDLATSQPMNCRWPCPMAPGPRLILKLSGWWLVRVFSQLMIVLFFTLYVW